MIAEHQAVRGRVSGAGVTSTLRPMSDASTRRTPVSEESRSRIEYSISLSSIRQFSETEVYGPTYASLITELRPMIAGPTIRLPATFAPASIRTRPMISLSASTSPSTSGSRVSSTDRLTSSMSVTLPVSFQ